MFVRVGSAHVFLSEARLTVLASTSFSAQLRVTKGCSQMERMERTCSQVAVLLHEKACQPLGSPTAKGGGGPGRVLRIMDFYPIAGRQFSSLLVVASC